MKQKQTETKSLPNPYSAEMLRMEKNMEIIRDDFQSMVNNGDPISVFFITQMKKFYLTTMLLAVADDSPWGLAIKNVLKTGSGYRLKTLLENLKSQNSDNPETMQRILK